MRLSLALLAVLAAFAAQPACAQVMVTEPCLCATVRCVPCIRSPSEMEAVFSDCPEAVANTLRVQEMVNLELTLGKPMLPTFKTPDGSDLETHLRSRQS